MNLFSKTILGFFTCTLFTGCTSAAENLDTHSFSEGISYVYDQKIVNGYPDGTFKPDNTINRAEFTKIIVSAVFEKNSIDECIIEDDRFSDINGNDWFAQYVCVALEENIINGYSDGTFKSANNISFVEAAKIIDIAFDGEEIWADPWYSPYVQNLGDFGVVPQSITTLDKNITRGEMAEMLWRWEKEVTHKNFMAFEEGKLVPLSSGEVIFGTPATSSNECIDGEVFDPEYKLCVLKDDAETQDKITEKIGDIETAPKIKEHNFSHTDEEGVLVHYKIVNNTLVPHLQGSKVTHTAAVKNTSLHKKTWENFYTLIPAHSAKKRITQFVLFESTTDTQGTLAYVHQVDGKPNEWVLGINYDENFNTDGTLKNPKDFYYTLIHEFTHVLALNEDNTNGFQTPCVTYEIETGCLKAESIMGNLVENFWKKSSHWSTFDPEGNNDDAGYARYESTPTRYSTDYAATNPGEDIAEVFTHFVLHEKPNGSNIKDQKIQMLYEYPEMVSLRNAIRSSLAKLSDTPIRSRK